MSSEPVAPNAVAPQEPAPIEQRLEYGEPLSPDQVLAIPQFEGISRGKLEKNPGTIVRRVAIAERLGKPLDWLEPGAVVDSQTLFFGAYVP